MSVMLCAHRNAHSSVVGVVNEIIIKIIIIIIITLTHVAMQYFNALMRQICKLKTNFVKVNAGITYILVQILNRLTNLPSSYWFC